MSTEYPYGPSPYDPEGTYYGPMDTWKEETRAADPPPTITQFPTFPSFIPQPNNDYRALLALNSNDSNTLEAAKLRTWASILSQEAQAWVSTINTYKEAAKNTGIPAG